VVVAIFSQKQWHEKTEKWLNMMWIQAYNEWGRFNVLQKAELDYASLFCDTEKSYPLNSKAVIEMNKAVAYLGEGALCHGPPRPVSTMLEPYGFKFCWTTE
jgi:hypothetical protein